MGSRALINAPRSTVVPSRHGTLSALEHDPRREMVASMGWYGTVPLTSRLSALSGGVAVGTMHMSLLTVYGHV